jgi:hypothetical protein
MTEVPDAGQTRPKEELIFFNLPSGFRDDESFFELARAKTFFYFIPLLADSKWITTVI